MNFKSPCDAYACDNCDHLWSSCKVTDPALIEGTVAASMLGCHNLVPPEYVHSVEKIGVVSVPFEDPEAADNKSHPSDHVGNWYCAGVAHCCSLDEHSDLPVPNLDLATGAFGSSLVHCLGNAVTTNVFGNGVVDDKVTHHPAL